MAKRQEPTNQSNTMDMPLREVDPIAPLGARPIEDDDTELQADPGEAPSELESEPESDLQPEPEVEATTEPDATSAADSPQASEAMHPTSTRELLRLMDDGWSWFRAAASSFPNEHMDEHLGEGWTRKQMLAHIAAWHDSTHDRLGTLIATGNSQELGQDVDRFNARIARQAIGRTAGEIFKDMEGTFNRLRRRVAQLSDDQIAAHDGWAARVIAGDTYEHYEEHRTDVNHTAPIDSRHARR